jgi:Ca2+-binding EF-hand superfamily protein
MPFTFKKKLGMIALFVTSIGAAGGVALAHEGGEGRRAKMLEKFDANHDGKLDAFEREAMRAAMQERRAQHKAKMLARFDANHDGKLDESERATMRSTLSAERFKKLDTNGDGVLSLDEFRAAHFGGFGRRGVE